MAFKLVSSTAQASGEVMGANVGFSSTVANALIPDGDILVTVSLVPAKGLWDDYETAPLQYTLTITNGESIPFEAPVSVEIGAFDNTLVDYVSNSASSSDNTLNNVNYDDTEGKLTFELTQDIAATTGVATVTFQMPKPTTP